MLGAYIKRSNAAAGGPGDVTSSWSTVGGLVNSPSNAVSADLTLVFYNGSGWVAYDDAVLRPVSGGPNVLPNPGFEASGGWTTGSPSSIGSNTTITRGTWGFATPQSGSYAYSMTTDAYGSIRSDQFPVTAGQDYDASAWIRGEVDTDDSRDTGTVWLVRVRWEDASGTNLGYSNAVVGSAAGGLPASFTEKGGTVTAPTGAAYGRAEVYFYLASGWLNVDDITVTPTTTVNITETKYYGFGGDTVGMRVDGELSWVFGDQLGSTGVTYKADGSGTVRQFYYPFGGIRNPGGAPVVDTDVGFTGQRLDETTGLMFYQARYYDPLTARFISADTMIPDPGNPQDFNRYSYVRNNPVKYTDPSGNCATRNGTIIDDASTDPCSPPGVRWVSMAEGLAYTGDGMPTCRVVPGLYQCTIDSNPGDPSLGYLIFGLIELGFNLSPLGVLTDLAECSEGNNVSCGFVGLEFFSGLGPLKRLLKNFKYVDEFFDLGRAADKVADSSSAARRGLDDLLLPGGTRIGAAGSRGSIREVTGGVEDAQALFTDLGRGGTVVTDTTYPGTLVRLPDGGTVGLRTTMTNSPGSVANIDVNITGIDITKIKFNP